jgi:hypothetical protein
MQSSYFGASGDLFGVMSARWVEVIFRIILMCSVHAFQIEASTTLHSKSPQNGHVAPTIAERTVPSQPLENKLSWYDYSTNTEYKLYRDKEIKFTDFAIVNWY